MKKNAHSSEEFSGEWAFLYNGILYMSLATIVTCFDRQWEGMLRIYTDYLYSIPAFRMSGY